MKLQRQILSFGSMTTSDFRLMDDGLQAETLINKGVFIAERTYKNFNILLYQVHNFYVEVYYNKRFNMMQGMSCFEDDESLEPFLEEIDISFCMK